MHQLMGMGNIQGRIGLAQYGMTKGDCKRKLSAGKMGQKPFYRTAVELNHTTANPHMAPGAKPD